MREREEKEKGEERGERYVEEARDVPSNARVHHHHGLAGTEQAARVTLVLVLVASTV